LTDKRDPQKTFSPTERIPFNEEEPATSNAEPRDKCWDILAVPFTKSPDPTEKVSLTIHLLLTDNCEPKSHFPLTEKWVATVNELPQETLEPFSKHAPTLICELKTLWPTTDKEDPIRSEPPIDVLCEAKQESQTEIEDPNTDFPWIDKSDDPIILDPNRPWLLDERIPEASRSSTDTEVVNCEFPWTIRSERHDTKEWTYKWSPKYPFPLAEKSELPVIDFSTNKEFPTIVFADIDTEFENCDLPRTLKNPSLSETFSFTEQFFSMLKLPPIFADPLIKVFFPIDNPAFDEQSPTAVTDDPTFRTFATKMSFPMPTELHVDILEPTRMFLFTLKSDPTIPSLIVDRLSVLNCLRTESVETVQLKPVSRLLLTIIFPNKETVDPTNKLRFTLNESTHDDCWQEHACEEMIDPPILTIELKNVSLQTNILDSTDRGPDMHAVDPILILEATICWETFTFDPQTSDEPMTAELFTYTFDPVKVSLETEREPPIVVPPTDKVDPPIIPKDMETDFPPTILDETFSGPPTFIKDPTVQFRLTSTFDPIYCDPNGNDKLDPQSKLSPTDNLFVKTVGPLTFNLFPTWRSAPTIWLPPNVPFADTIKDFVVKCEAWTVSFTVSEFPIEIDDPIIPLFRTKKFLSTNTDDDRESKDLIIVGPPIDT
jgi:hypothetical protein